MGSGACRRASVQQVPLVIKDRWWRARPQVGCLALIGRNVRSVASACRDVTRPTSADGAPEGLKNPGNDPGDSGQIGRRSFGLMCVPRTIRGTSIVLELNRAT